VTSSGETCPGFGVPGWISKCWGQGEVRSEVGKHRVGEESEAGLQVLSFVFNSELSLELWGALGRVKAGQTEESRQQTGAWLGGNSQ
jgi:hypothetical protein